MVSPLAYLRHVREEFAHITWPTGKTAVAHTLVVLVIAALIAVFVGALDALLRVVVGFVAGA
jgi:preprotein translocase SecE subunit